MRLDTSLQQRMDQRQTLDPRLIQAMEVLQLSAPALEQKVASELADNPALEIERTENDTWQWDEGRRRGGDGHGAARRVRSTGVKVSRLARGIPVGASLQGVSKAVLMHAVQGRQGM